MIVVAQHRQSYKVEDGRACVGTCAGLAKRESAKVGSELLENVVPLVQRIVTCSLLCGVQS